MENLTDIVWAQHIKIDNAQTLWKCPNKANQITFVRLNSERNLVMHFYKPYTITYSISHKVVFWVRLNQICQNCPISAKFNYYIQLSGKGFRKNQWNTLWVLSSMDRALQSGIPLCWVGDIRCNIT